jgi:hypothetical protein
MKVRMGERTTCTVVVWVCADQLPAGTSADWSLSQHLYVRHPKYESIPRWRPHLNNS